MLLFGSDMNIDSIALSVSKAQRSDLEDVEIIDNCQCQIFFYQLAQWVKMTRLLIKPHFYPCGSFGLIMFLYFIQDTMFVHMKRVTENDVFSCRDFVYLPDCHTDRKLK